MERGQAKNAYLAVPALSFLVLVVFLLVVGFNIQGDMYDDS